MITCRRIWARITPHAPHAAHPIRHAYHVARAHYVAQVVCHATVAGGLALGVGFGGAALIRHEAPEIVAPAVHAAEVPASREFDLPASAFVPPSWARTPFGLVRDADDHDRDDRRHRHHHYGSHPIDAPEPGTLALLLVGLVAVAGARRRA